MATGGACLVALVTAPRRFPILAAGALLASSALSLAETQLDHRPENTPGLLELCALLLMIARTVRQQSLLWCAVLVPGEAVAAAALFLRLSPDQLPELATYVAPALSFGMVLMVVLGLYLRRSDIYRIREREVAEQAARQNERLDYARELHDFVAHHVTAIVAQAKAARFVTAAGHAPSPTEMDRVLAGIEDAGSRAMQSMRSTVSFLRASEFPSTVHPAGDLTLVGDLVEQAAAPGRAVTLVLDPALDARVLPPEIMTVVHRVVQESITNICKHAGSAGNVTVDVRLGAKGGPGITVTVVDDNPTAPTVRGDSPSAPTGYGLPGLAERVDNLGGHLAAGPRENQPGWQVRAELPLSE
ncbi:sensor histidine kinase [Prescottella equi]